MQKCLLPQLCRNIHIYVDDIMVKTKQHLTLLDDLKETFANLREYKVKLNPENDSDLVVQQCSGEWDARDHNMASYRFLVQKLSGFFAGCEFLHVPHAENEAANTLAKIASSRQSIPSGVSLEHLHKPSVKPSLDSESIYIPDDPAAPQLGPGTTKLGPRTAEPGLGTTQPSPGAATLDLGTAVPNPGAAELGSGAAIPEPAMVAVFAVVTAPSWALPISDPTGVFQRYVEQDKGIDILLDIHQGECGHHAASRSLDIGVRYGMPNNIIMDNGTNFAKGALTQYCSVFGIRLDLASVAHLQSNGQSKP
ncbi:uncharacterized protein [Aegilops tauschii subsp. strangulata]|uniref:uncharacterized protein n=1 Tax=Aegilops tauschii subsp. strangulata TaxID=200361 RepID=UPI001ABD0E1B|nr:uncharacterized protein LOC120973966 [Aegilops tauschii subsp. strangulata]